jgi:hypothetical protein
VQPQVGHQALQLVAIQVAVLGIARPKVQVHGPACRVVPDKANQRADPGAGPIMIRVYSLVQAGSACAAG